MLLPERINGAVFPLPVNGDDCVIEQIASAPLVVCMRADDALAQQTDIQPSQLKKTLRIFRSPEAHPEVHVELMEMLADIGVDERVGLNSL